MKIINCRGLVCPQPVINTKKYFDEDISSEALVIVDNEVAKDNILRFATGTSLKSEVVEKDGIFEISLSKFNIDKPFTPNYDESKSRKKFSQSLIISTDLFGSGDDALGEILMKSYLYALTESSNLPENIVFLNSGVKLVTDNSTVLENLHILKNKGCNIYSCGTCLDFYQLKDKLQMGEIVNMYFIVELMNDSDNTIKI